jgi:hypothetical protein
MKRFLAISLCVVGVTSSNIFDDQVVDDDGPGDFYAESLGRTFYFNASDTATSVTLLSIYLLAGLIGYLLYTGYALSPLSNANFNRVQFNDNNYFYAR